MTDRDAALLLLEEQNAVQDEFRPHTLSQSVGLIEKKCSDSEMLQYLIAAESSRESLEHYAAELNRLLDQSAKATRQAEIAVQTKGDFLAMMSHEIRTPLSGILGMTGILLSKDLGPSERDCVETIRNSGEALLSIIDEILDFSKIEAGRLELECEHFEIEQAIQEAIQIVKGMVARKSLQLLFDLHPAVPRAVRGDAGRLRQILLNLLGNAVKFTQQGKIELKVELAGCRNGEYELRFSITDQGIGMTEEQQAKLFLPYSQAEASTSRRFGGTGLGLTICKRLAELMGGAIGVNSRPGEGSSFWFTIAVLPSNRAVPQPKPPAAKLSQIGPADKNFKILLVEDNNINKKVGLLILKSLGYRADVASNGFEALAAIGSKRYDLVLMDCLMPEMDGFEATRHIRSLGGYGAQMPIIAMTASAFAEDRDACLASGMTDYLSKPVREAELRAKLEFWLSGKGQPLGLTPAAAAPSRY